MKSIHSAVLSALGAVLIASAPVAASAAGPQGYGGQARQGSIGQPGQAGRVGPQARPQVGRGAPGAGQQAFGREMNIEMGPEGLPIIPGATELNQADLENLIRTTNVQGLQIAASHAKGEILGAYVVDQPTKVVGAFYMWALTAQGFQPEAMTIHFGDDPYRSDMGQTTEVYVSKGDKLYAMVFANLQDQTVVFYQTATEEDLMK